ncbi:MAG TPA: hypothetical protein VM100_11430, partial [Longimicrobiales bacterium]|nr:hypothetical protein [Longimicrobiales bacterium]
FLATRATSENHGWTQAVTFSEARSIIDRRCASCHSSNPSDAVFTAAPAGVKFDTPEMMIDLAPRIVQRAAIDKTMPLRNKTKITEMEREMLRVCFSAPAACAKSP